MITCYDDATVVGRRISTLRFVLHDLRIPNGPMPLPLARRVSMLEQDVTALNELPARMIAVEGHILALRADFTALRGEVNDLRIEVNELRGEVNDVRGGVNELRNELRSEVKTLRADMDAMRDELRAEIAAGDEETRRQMRVLHEDVISRIALLQEGINRINGSAGTPAQNRKRSRRS